MIIILTFIPSVCGVKKNISDDYSAIEANLNLTSPFIPFLNLAERRGDLHHLIVEKYESNIKDGIEK